MTIQKHISGENRIALQIKQLMSLKYKYRHNYIWKSLWFKYTLESRQRRIVDPPCCLINLQLHMGRLHKEQVKKKRTLIIEKIYGWHA